MRVLGAFPVPCALSPLPSPPAPSSSSSPDARDHQTCHGCPPCDREEGRTSSRGSANTGHGSNAECRPFTEEIHTQTIGINTTTGAVDPKFPTYFLVGPSINTSSFGALAEQFVSQTSAVSGTFKNLYITIPTAAGPGSLGTTSTYTWRVNGISTGITCTIIAPALTCSDLTHTAPIVAGQSYDLQTVGVGSTFSAVFGGIELDTP